VRKNGVFVVLALAFVITFSAVGDILLVDLPAEPRTPPVPALTLDDAARRNDYAAFDALYITALNEGRDVSRYADLHRLWKYSMTDPVGGFYGPEMHAELDRAYPGYAAFIEDFKIVDANGNAFYPSSETRAFLRRNAGAGTARTRPLIAQAKPRIPVEDRSPRLSVVAKQEQVAAPAPQALKRTEEVSVLPVTPSPAPVRVATARPATTSNPQPTAPNKASARPDIARGILLIILGLLGIGVVSVMLHTPADEPRSVTHI
jgi:hypothetical protein